MIFDADTHISPYREGVRITVERLLELMDMSGVDCALTWLQEPYLRVLDESNEYVYRSVSRHADRLTGFGWLDPHFGLEHCMETIRRCTEEYGFGFNYAQLAQSQDFELDPQEYSGFSILSEEKRREILDLVFGEDGLIKMFFDPFHQTPDRLNKPGFDNLDQSVYDHEISTKWVRYFAREGLKISRAHGRDLTFMICLYGVPAFMTLQKQVRARDIDPRCVEELAKYMVSYAKFLRERRQRRRRGLRRLLAARIRGGIPQGDPPGAGRERLAGSTPHPGRDEQLDALLQLGLRRRHRRRSGGARRPGPDHLPRVHREKHRRDMAWGSPQRWYRHPARKTARSAQLG